MSQLNDQLMALKAREQTLLSSEFDLEEEQKQAGMGHSANEVKRSVKITVPIPTSSTLPHSHSPLCLIPSFHSVSFPFASFPVSILSHSHLPHSQFPFCLIPILHSASFSVSILSHSHSPLCLIPSFHSVSFPFSTL